MSSAFGGGRTHTPFRRQLLRLVRLPIPPRTQLTDREGFEPPEPFSSSVFKTDAINHSTTCPILFQNTIIIFPGYCFWMTRYSPNTSYAFFWSRRGVTRTLDVYSSGIEHFIIYLQRPGAKIDGTLTSGTSVGKNVYSVHVPSLNHAPGETRTHKPARAEVFETSVYTIPPQEQLGVSILIARNITLQTLISCNPIDFCYTL